MSSMESEWIFSGIAQYLKVKKNIYFIKSVETCSLISNSYHLFCVSDAINNLQITE